MSHQTSNVPDSSPRRLQTSSLLVLCLSGACLLAPRFAEAQTYTTNILANFTTSQSNFGASTLAINGHGDLIGSQSSDYTPSNMAGSIFELTNTGTSANPTFGSAVVTVSTFNGADGLNPLAGVTLDASGNLYGVTNGGGNDSSGTAFEVVNTGTVNNPVYSNVPTDLGDFAYATTGENARGGVTFDSNGNFFGTTPGGSSTGGGTVFEFANSGTLAAPSYSGPANVYKFSQSGAFDSPGHLSIDQSGNIFGTTELGGDTTLNYGFGYGTVYELVNTGTVAAPKYANGINVLGTFNATNGETPLAGVTIDGQGDILGTTSTSGAGSNGTAWEIKNTGTLTAPVYAGGISVLVNFNEPTNGADPQSGLTLDSAGNLYGDTISGGADGNGTVFKITNTGTVGAPVYGAETVIAGFGTVTGASPIGGLVINSQGDVFGTTDNNGANGDGTIFELIPSSSGAATAPEPGSLGLIVPALGVLAAGAIRRRRS